MITTEEFMDIIALHHQGLSMRAIARKLGMHRNTVKKHIEGGAMPGHGQSSGRPSILDPYRQLIDAYLAEDDYQATWLSPSQQGDQHQRAQLPTEGALYLKTDIQRAKTTN